MSGEIHVLKISFQFGAAEDAIYPVVLRDEHSCVLVDCGYMGFLPLIEEAMDHEGIAPQSLTKVLITHHDHDHMGALKDLKDKYPQVQIMAGRLEAPYISGKRKSLRLAQAEALQPLLPPEQQEGGRQFIGLLEGLKSVPVDITLEDGQLLDVCGGCRVVETPGHTPGHISLYLPAHSVLIAGDAMIIEDGRPALANPQFTLDVEAAQLSMKKLLDMGAASCICYHSGVYRTADIL